MAKTTFVAAFLAIAFPLSAAADDCSFNPRQIQSTSGAAVELEDLAWNGFEVGVLTHADAAGGTLLFTRYSRDMERLGPDITVATNVLPSTGRLIWNGSMYGSFFRDIHMKLRYRPLATTGDPLGPSVDLHPDKGFSSNETFDVGWDQDVFFVAETYSPPPTGILLTEVEPTGAIRSTTIVNIGIRDPVSIDLVIAPHARFVIFDATQRGGGATTQIIQSVRGTSPRLRGSSMAGTAADGFWDGQRLVLIGKLEPLSETRELTVATFDGDGLALVAEKTFLKTTETILVPGEVLLGGGEIIIPYVSTRPGLPGELRLLRMNGAFETISDSRMVADPRFTLAEPDLRLVWTGTNVIAGIYREAVDASYLSTFCPLKATIVGPSLVKSGTNVVYSSIVTGGKEPIAYRWERDTSIVTSTGPTVNERFPLAREYTVRLRVSDAIGQDYVTTRTVTAVTELPPLTVSIAVTPQSATVGAGVTFTATAGGGVGPFSYRWVFADGRVFEGASVTAPFMTGGSHAATVTVTDAAGQTATASAVVQVTASRRRPVSRP